MKYTHLILYGLLATAGVYFFVAQQHTTVYLPAKIEPKTALFTFDLHGVLFTKNYKQIISLVINSEHRGTLLLHGLNPFVLKDVFNLWWGKRVVEEYIEHLTTAYPQLAPCRPLFIEVANAQTPIKETVALVKQLKNSGYTVGIFSNIGTLALNDLTQKYPDIFAVFDHLHTTSKADQYMSKKDDIFYLRYAQLYNKEHKTIVFIDDKKKNIEKAHTHGWYGVQYTNAATLSNLLKPIIGS